MAQIRGTVSGVIYRNAENGYAVISVQSEDREYMVVGTLPQVAEGETGVFDGEWTEHARYGSQLKCTHYELSDPTSLAGIEKYLATLPHLGEKSARDLVKHFGTDVLRIMEEEPERLREVKGMGGKKRYLEVAAAFHERRQERDGMIYLQGYGITPALAVKIAQKYGEHTRDVVSQNPYRLCEEIDGIGFETADRIGLTIGIPRESEFRIFAGIKYALTEAAIGSGHIYLPEAELKKTASILLRLDEALIANVLENMILRRDLTANRGPDDALRVYLPHYDNAEREVARRLCELIVSAPHGDTEHTEREIDRFEKYHNISFSRRQRDAIVSALEMGVLVITGGPGTGKTTIINCILSLLSRDQNVLLCAPTGRAAKRMSEATGTESKTIHRLLEFSGETGGFTRNQEKPLECDCVIVDEMSMVDLMLMRALTRALEPGMRLILVGDSDQLPSVGAGNVLSDILESGVVPCARLTEIFRQSGESRIVTNAHRINHGELPVLNEKGTDFFFERKLSFPDTAKTIVQLASVRLPKFLGFTGSDMLTKAMQSIQILCPARKGDCGANTLNALLQSALNPPSPDKPSVEYGSTVFRLGDKVMQVRNDYDLVWEKETPHGWESGTGVFNGDVGYVVEVDPDEGTLTVLFDEEREAVYSHKMLENLELAYALSIHKSQGSEFPAVIIPVAGGPQMLLTRNLFYTALTRAKKLVVLVGREEIIAQMVNNNYIRKRYTTLPERLMAMQRLMEREEA